MERRGRYNDEECREEEVLMRRGRDNEEELMGGRSVGEERETQRGRRKKKSKR